MVLGHWMTLSALGCYWIMPATICQCPRIFIKTAKGTPLDLLLHSGGENILVSCHFATTAPSPRQLHCPSSIVLPYSGVIKAISKTQAINTINISAPVSSCHDMLATPAPMPRQPLILTLVCNFSHRWPY